jgi:hypothetical protein
MDDADTLWKDYETLEKMTGEHLAEKVLPEFSEKHMHANAIFRERKRVSSKIELDRLAVPPTNGMQELQQLSAWNKWIRYDCSLMYRMNLEGPDNLCNTSIETIFSHLLFIANVSGMK